ncbi:MAG TPA: fibronectin type III domain-containing protein, partial [Solirubrobacteraceae bacterium]|nr:fibronectin type III domain-containing protein [Solirubrobacteraceae bacterium]
MRRTTPSDRDTRKTARRGRARRATAVIVAAGLAPLASGAFVASAAVPAFPDNLVIFPERDFITVEGFQNRVGETATLEITRGSTVIGSARAVVQAGEVAFEINHPGGVCWGAGTGLDVTPDIQAGDKATISFAGEAAGDTTVQDTYVTGVNYTPGQATFTVVGKVAEGVERAQMEQRIVNPDLTDTAVGRRDVRAVPGGLVRADKGGYSSNLEFSGDSFTATYVFDDPEVARIAATGGGERIMAWQEQDLDDNRQGLTISEHGEIGGPGMGGCPAGPSEQSAPRPGTAAVVRSEDKQSLQVTWAPATAQPGSAPVTGYSVVAIEDETSAFGEQSQVGVRTGAPSTRTTIDGLDPAESYTVEVRSLAGARMSEAFAVTVPGQTPDAPTGDLTAPVVTATPEPVDGIAAKTKTVTLVANEDVDIYYTTDGSGVLANGDLPSDTAQLYT